MEKMNKNNERNEKTKRIKGKQKEIEKKKQIRTFMCISLHPSYTADFHHPQKLSSEFSANLSIQDIQRLKFNNLLVLYIHANSNS